jgi:hypothetical protein
MGRARHVHDAASCVLQDDQDEEESTRGCRHDEEVGRGDLADMIREKRAPRLGGRSSVPRHVIRHRGLTDVDAELQEFAVNAWRTPQRVGVRHGTNQLTDVPRDARPTQPASAFPRPEEPKTTAVPSQHCLGLDDHNDTPPSIQEFRQPDPRHSVGMRERQALWSRSTHNMELMVQRQNLKLEGRPSAE